MDTYMKQGRTKAIVHKKEEDFRVSVNRGLSEEEAVRSRKKFGSNRLSRAKRISFFKKFLHI